MIILVWEEGVDGLEEVWRIQFEVFIIHYFLKR